MMCKSSFLSNAFSAADPGTYSAARVTIVCICPASFGSTPAWLASMTSVVSLSIGEWARVMLRLVSYTQERYGASPRPSEFLISRVSRCDAPGRGMRRNSA